MLHSCTVSFGVDGPEIKPAEHQESERDDRVHTKSHLKTTAITLGDFDLSYLFKLRKVREAKAVCLWYPCERAELVGFDACMLRAVSLRETYDMTSEDTIIDSS